MVIEEKDFKLEFDEDCSRFDLYFLKVINAKDAEKRREEFVLRGYSYTLETALQLIIENRLSKRLETVTIKKYLEEYYKETSFIKNLTSSLCKMSSQKEI